MENKINKLFLESINQNIETILDNQIKIKLFFDSYVRGFHVYKDVWSSLIGEEVLECFHEKENKTFAVAVYRNDLSRRINVGHVPINISKLLVKFLQLPNSFPTCKVTGRRVNRGAGYGLEIPVNYTCTGHQKTVDWIKKKINEEKKCIKKQWFKITFLTIFFPCPLITERSHRKSQLVAKKIYPLTRMSANWLSAN